MSGYNGLPLSPLQPNAEEFEKKKDFFWRMMFIMGISNEEALKYIQEACPTSFNTFLNMQWNGHNLKNCAKDVQEISVEGDDEASPSRKRRVSFNVTSQPPAFEEKSRLVEPEQHFHRQNKVFEEEQRERLALLAKLKDLTLTDISCLQRSPRH